MSTISIQPPMTARTAAPATRLRLTARGRRVLLALASAPVAAGIVFSALAGGSALASGEQAAVPSFETVTVMPGDTLWSIAADAAPDADPREVVDAIMRLNSLPSGMIQTGTTLALPAEYAD
ncbi:LysM peptidoglycan-binding domain-containing protein [Microbacterium sp. NPDC058345]|uniref:LysM peptidoglycan-binding domain-containing protein n=1 Tax=Microbacterium sp. NPDC058345 TaxID=3346455 RepID=UPI0036527A11